MGFNLNRFISASLGFAVIASLIWGFSERGLENSLRSDLDKEKLKSESVLSEKLSIEKERDKSASKAEQALRRSDELSHEIERIEKKLKENSKQLQRALAENSDSKEKYTKLLAERQGLDEQLVSLTQEQQSLQDRREYMNEELNTLRAENQKLQSDLRAARLSHFDTPLVKATGGSDKLVVKASRVKRLMATLSIGSDAIDAKFTIINPMGRVLTEKDGISASRIVNSTPTSMQLEMTFSPKKKLQPGLYQIEVVSGDVHVASLQVSLR